MAARLTAAQALDIAKAKDPSTIVDAILERVRAAAEAGEYSVQIRDHGFGSSVWYGDGTKEGKAVMAELRKLGFRTQTRSEDRQFTDFWLEVSWNEVGHG